MRNTKFSTMERLKRDGSVPRDYKQRSGIRKLMTPELGKPTEVHSGILVLRLPLPFALDHINVYLLDEGDGWSVVDSGLDTSEARDVWEVAFRSPMLRGRPIKRILITHHHPDHIGLAGWLARRWAIPIEITEMELEFSSRYADPNRDPHKERIDFWTENGMPEKVAKNLAGSMPNYLRSVHALPDDISPINIRRPLKLGGRSWFVIIGEGHSPCHVSLFNKDEDVLISGDQVLPEISPNIGVWPDGPQDPLGDYLRTVEPFANLGQDPLVLPSHRSPFRGLAERVNELMHHHDVRLAALVKYCSSPISCFDALASMFDRQLEREQLGFAMAEGLAHLHYLMGIGELGLISKDGVRCFQKKG